ncbi:MAG: peroxiredoxin [Hyphomicrobium sp.]
MPPRAPVDDGGACHLVRGLTLPNVALPSTLGGTLNLSAQSGTAVIYFYPWTGRPGLADPPGWDDIPGAHGSTPEAEGFRDHYPAFREIAVAVVGVSTQGSEHQREFADRLNVAFAILSDEAFLLQKALKLPAFETGGVAYLKRLTLIVRDGRIEHVFYPVPTPAAHVLEVFAWLTQTRLPGAA